jgi:hypothetical protein
MTTRPAPQTTADPAHPAHPHPPADDAAHCPVCGKAYQRPNVNAADYRVDYLDQTQTEGHMCAHCWRTRPVW